MPIVDYINRTRSENIKGKWLAPKAMVCTDIEIGNPAIRPTRRNLYVVTVSFMYGDADGEGSETVTFKGSEKEEMIDFLNFLARCAAAYPNGRGGSDDYYHIEGWDKWTESGEGDGPHVLEWQHDPSCDGAVATFNHASVVWYNDDGVKYNCGLVAE